MRLLLDTHIWLWSLSDQPRLAPQVRRALAKPVNELWLSPVSTWEVAWLVEKQRITLDTHFEAWLPRALGSAPFREALFTHDIAAAVRDVRLPHRDPADLLLVATARVLNLTLVTADERLIGAKQVPTLANR